MMKNKILCVIARAIVIAGAAGMALLIGLTISEDPFVCLFATGFIGGIALFAWSIVQVIFCNGCDK